jgi:carbonic anhydrase/acetyltransferase-like protein (isoleucine patch superfamily)
MYVEAARIISTLLKYLSLPPPAFVMIYVKQVACLPSKSTRLPSSPGGIEWRPIDLPQSHSGERMSIRTYMEHTPVLADGVFIDESAVVIGRVTLAADVSIWPLTVLRGDVQDIKIGARTNIQDGSVLHNTSAESQPPHGFPLLIGEDVTVGHKAILHGCTIGDRVLIGMGAIVLDGAVVQAEVIVGAGSIVSPGKILESGGLYLGAPAKRVRELRPQELEFLRHSAAHYVKLKNNHLSSSRNVI